MPKGHRRDISGLKFGRLTAIAPTERRSEEGSVIWKLRCDCGTEDIEATIGQLITKHSCGCIRRERHERGLRRKRERAEKTTMTARGRHERALRVFCRKCGRTPEQGAVFGANLARASGRQGWCSDCHAAHRTKKDGRVHGWANRIAAAGTEQARWEVILKSMGLGIDAGNHSSMWHFQANDWWDEAVDIEHLVVQPAEIMMLAGVYGTDAPGYKRTVRKYEWWKEIR